LGCRALLGIPSEALVLVTVGRLNRNKGWELLLEALARLHRRRPESRLIFVGDGEDRLALEARIDAMGLRSRVEVTGVLGPDLIREYLSAADVFVCGSLIEGWPSAMLEALACAKPVVTTRVSGATSLVRQAVNGFVLEDRDPETFARAVEDTLRLESAAVVSRDLAMRYSLATLSEDLRRAWPALRGAGRVPEHVGYASAQA
jgi:glycosyltransferase involved in cell wall biosynthesis